MTTIRKMASVQQVLQVEPIENADMIEKVRINGWWVVVQKELNYKVGDSVVYFEIDSFLPESKDLSNPYPWQFLVDKQPRTFNNEKGTVIRTIRLRGTYSQGFVLPLDKVVDMLGIPACVLEVGTDLTEQLGVEKYEPPLPASLSGDAKGNFPSFVPKTEAIRIQNVLEFNSLFGQPVEITEKLDGTSLTVIYNNGELEVCSRNLSLKETEGNTYWEVTRAYDLESKLKATGRNLAIQGEVIGSGIQGNQYKINKHSLFVFSVYDIDNSTYLTPSERATLVAELGLAPAPLLETTTFNFATVDQALEYAEGNSTLNNSKREGVVFKFENMPNVIIKAISNSWLLKNQ